MFIRYLSLLALSVFAFSCGQDYQEKDVKNFVLATTSNDENIKDLLARLVNQFNQNAEFQALSYTYDPSAANSIIEIVPTLLPDTGFIGLTSSNIDIKEESSTVALTGKRPERTNVYSMHIELDEPYLKERLKKNDETANYELEKLFDHEVGHGLTMGHEKDANDVMHEVVNNVYRKDMKGFFRRVRAFFGINS